MRDIIEKIIEDLNEIDKIDVFKECVKDRLNKSLLLYYNELEESYQDLLGKDYQKVVSKIINKGEN